MQNTFSTSTPSVIIEQKKRKPEGNNSPVTESTILSNKEKEIRELMKTIILDIETLRIINPLTSLNFSVKDKYAFSIRKYLNILSSLDVKAKDLMVYCDAENDPVLISMTDLTSPNNHVGINNSLITNGSENMKTSKIPLISRVNLKLNGEEVGWEGKNKIRNRVKKKHNERRFLEEVIPTSPLNLNHRSHGQYVRPKSSAIFRKKNPLPTSLLQMKEIRNNRSENHGATHRPIFRTKMKVTAGGYPVTRNANRIGITGSLSSSNLLNRRRSKQSFSNSLLSEGNSSINNNSTYAHNSQHQFQQINFKNNSVYEQAHFSNWGGGYPFDTNNYISDEYLL